MRWLLYAVVGVCLLGFVGCQSNRNPDDPDNPDSEMPWNTPRSWEGTIPLPIPGGGMGGQY